MKRVGRSVQMAAGLAALLCLWQILGQTKALGPAFSSLSQVCSTLLDPSRRSLFSSAIAATSASAAWGLLLGGVVGCVAAAVCQAIGAFRRGWDRFAVSVHAIPQIGVAPVLIVTLGRSEAPAALAAMAAFFPAYAAATTAFASSSAVHRDLFSVNGSSRTDRMLRLQLPVAAPGLCDAMRLAAPGAVLGAVLGEWFGAPSGIGLIILSSSQNYQIDQLWASATLATLLAMAGYGAFSVLQVLANRRYL